MKKIFLLLFILSSQFFTAQTQDKKLHEKYHEFDFWLGNWDVYKFGTDTVAGKSRAILQTLRDQRRWANALITALGKTMHETIATVRSKIGSGAHAAPRNE